MSKANGHYDLSNFKDAQDQRFQSLESILEQGFSGVTEELRLLRQQGYVPVSVLEKITDQQKAFVNPIIRVLCTSLVVTILWFTGLKALLPQIFPN